MSVYTVKDHSEDSRHRYKLHKLLFQHIERSMTDGDIKQFENMARGPYLAAGTISRCDGDMYKILDALEKENVFSVGNYDKLLRIFLDAKLLKLYHEVRIKGDEIQNLLNIQVWDRKARRHATVVGVNDSVVQEVQPCYKKKLQQLKDKSDRCLQQCKANEQRFVSTGPYEESERKLSNHQSLLVVGDYGDGKTWILQRLASDFSDKGFLVIFLRNPSDIDKHLVPGQKTLFVFDDVLGTDYPLQTKVEEWMHLGELGSQRILLSTDIKLLFSCRLFIWSDCKKSLENLSIFNTTVDVRSCQLTFAEKVQILRSHLPGEIFPGDKAVQEVCSFNTIAFPRSCLLIRESVGILQDDYRFVKHFTLPLDRLSQMLDYMSSREKWKYSAMVAIFLNGGSLPCDVTHLTPAMKKMILHIASNKTCSNQQKIQKLLNSAEQLVGIYVRKSSVDNIAIFQFSYSFFLECLALHFGCQDKQTFIKYCKPSLLLSLVRTTSTSKDSDKSSVCLPQALYNLFVEILSTEMITGNHDLVLNCPVILDADVQRSWVKLLETNTGIFSHYVGSNGLASTVILYRFISSGVDHLAAFLLSHISSYPLRFHPIVALASGGRINQIERLIHRLNVHFFQSGSSDCIGNQAFKTIKHKRSYHVNEMDVISEEIWKDVRNRHADELSEIWGHALVQALCEGQDKVAKLLVDSSTRLKKRCQVSVLSLSVGEALCSAFNEGNRGVVERLLQMDFRASVLEEALVTSTKKGNRRMIQMIISRGVTPQSVGSAIISASACSQKRILKVLLEHPHPLESVHEAISQAVWRGNKTVVKVILQKSASQFHRAVLDKLVFEALSYCKWSVARNLLDCYPEPDYQNGTIDTRTSSGEPDNGVTLVDSVSRPFYMKAMRIATGSGNLEKFRRLLHGSFAVDMSLLLQDAAGAGSRTLVGEILPFCNQTEGVRTVLKASVEHKNISLTQWAIQQNPNSEAIQELLIDATLKRDFELVNTIVSVQVSRDIVGCVLVEAASFGSAHLVAALVKHSPTPEAIGLALDYAITHRQGDVAKILLRQSLHGNDVRSCMVLAAQGGDAKMFKSLLGEMCCPEAVFESMLWASRAGHLEIIQAVPQEQVTCDSVESAIAEASRRGQHRVLEYMLQYHPRPESVQRALLQAAWVGNVCTLKHLLTSLGQLDNDFLDRVLRVSVCQGHVEITKLLMTNEIDPTILGKLATESVRLGNYELVELFLSRCLPVHSLSKITEGASWDGQTHIVKQIPLDQLSPKTLFSAIWSSLFQGHDSITELFLDSKLDEETLCRILIYASRCADQNLTKVLLRKNLGDETLSTALHAATLANNMGMVQLLLSSGVSQHAKRCAVLSAAHKGLTDILREISQNISSDILEESLLRASLAGKLATVKYLLGRGLSKGVTSEAIDLATIGGHVEVIYALIQNSASQEPLV